MCFLRLIYEIVNKIVLKQFHFFAVTKLKLVAKTWLAKNLKLNARLQEQMLALVLASRQVVFMRNFSQYFDINKKSV